MVALSPNFAVLASFAALAATLLAPVNGVAIPSTPYRSQSDRQSDEAAKFDKHRSGSASSAQSQSAAAEPEHGSAGGGLPLPIPLPSLGRRINSNGQPLSRRWDPLDPLVEIGDLYIGDNPSHGASAQSEAFSATNTNSRVHSTSERVHTANHASEEGVHMIVTGSNEHIHVDRSPEPHRHHHDDDYRHSRVIVSGDNDDVHLNNKRAPRHHHHGSHRYHHYHWKRDTNGSSQPLVDPTGTILVPLGKRGARHEKRELGGFDGVPGIIDIMSNVAGSNSGQRVASLVLAPAINGVNSSDPFVLNASGTNKTQVYLIVLDDDDSSPSTFNPNRSTSSSVSTNSTMPSNATSADNSTAPTAQSLDASASMSLDASASASVSSDNSTSSSGPSSPFKRVALQIPVFDPQEAALKPFCATFDPQPSAPSPLTVESCSEGVVEAEHKSQVFAYDPLTGIIQPMWFDGEDDGTDGNSSDNAESDDSSSTSAPATSASAASDDDVDASADVGAAVARLNSLNRELIGDASGGHNFAARDSYSAQNVTLKFTPLAPVLPQQDMPTEAQGIDSATTPGSSDAPTTTSSSSGASSTTLGSLSSSAASSSAALSSSFMSSASSDGMASATFVPAAVSSSAPTDTPINSTSAVATTASSAVLSSATETGSATVASSTTDTSAEPTSSAHGLGVEVFDPSAEASTTSVSSGSMTSADETSTPSSVPASASATASVSGSSGSAAPSMTPVSTSPYEWMFRETTRKN